MAAGPSGFPGFSEGQCGAKGGEPAGEGPGEEHSLAAEKGREQMPNWGGDRDKRPRGHHGGLLQPRKAARRSLEESMQPPGQRAGQGFFTTSVIFILTPAKQNSHHFL